MQAIYQIQNKINNKIYIGSTNNVRKRWNNHRSKLNNGKHENQYLQLAWQKYGQEAFEFTIVEEVNDNNRIEREIYYLNEKKSYERDIGYNFDKNPTDKSGINNSFYGKQHSEETKQKLREIANKRSPELKKLMGAKNKGSNNKNTKLNMEIARQIRAEYASGEWTYEKLQNKYNVAHGTIQAILTKRTWKEE
jgi:group I intron endonuclease